jgi:hypothetical protein
MSIQAHFEPDGTVALVVDGAQVLCRSVAIALTVLQRVALERDEDVTVETTDAVGRTSHLVVTVDGAYFDAADPTSTSRVTPVELPVGVWPLPAVEEAKPTLRRTPVELPMRRRFGRRGRAAAPSADADALSSAGEETDAVIPPRPQLRIASPAVPAPLTPPQTEIEADVVVSDVEEVAAEDQLAESDSVIPNAAPARVTRPVSSPDRSRGARRRTPVVAIAVAMVAAAGLGAWTLNNAFSQPQGGTVQLASSDGTPAPTTAPTEAAPAPLVVVAVKVWPTGAKAVKLRAIDGETTFVLSRNGKTITRTVAAGVTVLVEQLPPKRFTWTASAPGRADARGVLIVKGPKRRPKTDKPATSRPTSQAPVPTRAAPTKSAPKPKPKPKAKPKPKPKPTPTPKPKPRPTPNPPDPIDPDE